MFPWKLRKSTIISSPNNLKIQLLIILFFHFSRGFITFEKPESAERAISERDGSMVAAVQLKVALARRQPVIEAVQDVTSSSMWSSLSANFSQKSAHKDRRELKVYEEELFN